MKRLGMLALAVLMVAAVTIPVWAMESEFGGYFRTRMYTLGNFTGEDGDDAVVTDPLTGIVMPIDSKNKDVSAIDTRTRLYYTAIFHENLKFVNKFEFDAAWGTNTSKGTQGYGDIGADGVNIEIKNSYVDFNPFPFLNSKVGIMGFKQSRGLLFDDDFPAVVLTFKGDNFTIPLIHVKAWEGGVGGEVAVETVIPNPARITNPNAPETVKVLQVYDTQDYDVDYYGISPTISIPTAGIVINPYLYYVYSNNVGNGANSWVKNGQTNPREVPLDLTAYSVDEIGLYFAGLDFDMKMDMLTLYASAIYEGGTVDMAGTDVSVDISAWAANLGGSVGMGWGDIHFQGMYATGQDQGEEDFTRYWVPRGQSFYWAEIMGWGMFGDTNDVPGYGAPNSNQNLNNTYGDQFTDMMAVCLGVSFKPIDPLKITLDAWAAWKAEDIYYRNGVQTTRLDPLANSDTYMGTELDLIITYELVKGLNLDVVGAYLFAGEAVTLDSPNDANPYEVGARLSLNF